MTTGLAEITRAPSEGGDLESHLASLGLISTSAYKLWCRRHGFAMDLHKTDSERVLELEFARKLAEPEDPDADRAHDPRRADLIQRVFDGEFDDQSLTDLLSRVRRLFTEVENVPGGREALLALLLHVEKYGNLLVCYDAAPRGFSQRNLVISGLSQLALYHRQWIRPLSEWRPSRRRPDTQFADLAAYLFARYPVPRCLHHAWFEEDEKEARIQQRWYLHIGSGQNIRTAGDLPFALTKRAAHLFMTSDNRRAPLIALRAAQIRAIDVEADHRLAWSLADNEYIRSRANADFWTGVVHFFLNNPMVDRSYIGPIVDYVRYMKFENRRVPLPGGQVQVLPPEHPSFCIKARSMVKLVREVDNWHMQLSGADVDYVEEWDSCGLSGFELTEDNDKLKNRITWTIQELRTSALLQVEGRILNHCVGSFTKRCSSGEVSVWSLRSRVDTEEAEQRHVLTIAVDNAKRRVTQARGKCNLQPHSRRMSNRQRRADGRYLVALRESARILSLWRTEQGLSYSEG